MPQKILLRDITGFVDKYFCSFLSSLDRYKLQYRDLVSISAEDEDIESPLREYDAIAIDMGGLHQIIHGGDRVREMVAKSHTLRISGRFQVLKQGK
jgi:hypothetical protein